MSLLKPPPLLLGDLTTAGHPPSSHSPVLPQPLQRPRPLREQEQEQGQAQAQARESRDRLEGRAALQVEVVVVQPYSVATSTLAQAR